MVPVTSNSSSVFGQAERRKPGLYLREMRIHAGLKMREVVAASKRLAKQKGDSRYAIVLSRLSMIEQYDVVPSIFRLYTLSAVYGSDLHTLLRLYGIE